MKKILCSLFVLSMLNAVAQNKYPITPMPVELKASTGSCEIRQPFGFILHDMDKHADDNGTPLFQEYLRKKLHITKIIDGDTHSYGLPTEIHLGIPQKNTPDGYYELEVKNQQIKITGNAIGTFYAYQTLMQLVQKKAGKYYIPNCSIKDYPRFAYRGMHLDVGRHFFSVNFIKKYIDYLATYKYNNFHWHLTEDQGWRIEIKKYPLLTQVGSCRDRTLIGRYGSNRYDSIPYCGYYTQQQVKEIVKYAAERYITVIPEIEMPGHSTAALASYPYLGCTKGPYKVMDTWGVLDDVYCAGNDSTYRFLQDVLDEVMGLFPSKYIHIGGDECPKERWKICPVCQKKIKDEGLKDEHALQSYFIQRIEKYLNSKGRKIIGWDEILEGGLAPNATVMSWRGEEGGIAAAKDNHDVIMTPGSHCYLDHSQSRNEDSVTIGGYLPLEKVYAYEPIPAVLNASQAKYILGAQGNVWTEYMANPEKVEYMIFPRMIALSEVLWSQKEKRNWNDFEKRLPGIFERLKQAKINFSGAYYDLSPTILPTENYDGVLYKLETKDKSLFIRYMDDDSKIQMNLPQKNEQGKKEDVLSDVYWGQGKNYSNPILIKSSNTILSSSYKGKEQISNTIEQNFIFNKATGKKISINNAPSKSYPGDGAFTLVNGVQNKKGLAKSSEFLGFLSGCEAIIDMGNTSPYNQVVVHALRQEGSWIWQPLTVTVFTSQDGVNYTSMGLTDDFVIAGNSNGTMTVKFGNTSNRFIKVQIENWGTIPSGKPGASNTAWLFVDEIEVN